MTISASGRRWAKPANAVHRYLGGLLDPFVTLPFNGVKHMPKVLGVGSVGRLNIT
jgi:hypothetical protein